MFFLLISRTWTSAAAAKESIGIDAVKILPSINNDETRMSPSLDGDIRAYGSLSADPEITA